jgi:hypothetical protein
MALMVRSLFLVFLTLLPAAAQDYWHRVTGSLGGFIPASGTDTVGFDSAAVLAIDYGFRFSRHGQFDAGIDAAFASRYNRRTNIYVPRVGYSVIAPLWQDRIEAVIGAGGAHSLFKPKIAAQSWLVYGQFGANYALDSDSRYRAGMMVRWYRDPVGRPVQQWVSVAATITYNWQP